MLQEIVQQIEETARDVINEEVHTALAGKIVSYSPINGTVKVKPLGKYTMPDGQRVDYPILPDLPLVFPCSSSKGVGIGFPIHKNDTCLIIISELGLDELLTGSPADEDLKYDLSNGIVIPGLLKKSNEITKLANKKDAVIVGNEKNYISVGRNDINIKGTITVEGNINYTGDIHRIGG